MRAAIISTFAPVALLTALAGCPAKVATVEVAPAKVELKSESDTATLKAIPKTDDGKDVAEKTATWTSSDPKVVTVDATGKLKATGSGAATVTAKVDEATGTAQVSVSLVKGLKVGDPTVVLVLGEPAKKVTAQFVDEKGASVEPGDKKVLWTSANAAIATVDAEGNIAAVSAGSTTVSAKFGELPAVDVVVTVNPAEVAPPAVPEAVPGDKAAAPAKPGKG
jgi:uncharacterized protein YjdB